MTSPEDSKPQTGHQLNISSLSGTQRALGEGAVSRPWTLCNLDFWFLSQGLNHWPALPLSQPVTEQGDQRGSALPSLVSDSWRRCQEQLGADA